VGTFNHPEHLNTPRLVANDQQQTVWRWEQQEPFGQNAANDDADGNSVAFEFNLRFPGQYFDKETNAHYNYFRDYDPAIGRYVQSDPIGLRGGLNTFAYVNSRPVERSDFTGLEDDKSLNVGQTCFASCIAVTAYRCTQQPQIGFTICASCFWLRSPPLVGACLAACTRNPTAVCVAVATVGCTVACAIADYCLK